MIETVIALGLMVTIILEVSTVMGNSISFAEYERKVTQAGWLAKSVFSKLERARGLYDLSDFEMNVKDQEFDQELCPKEADYPCDYKYNLEVREWRLPIVELISKQLGVGGGEQSPILGMVKEQVKNILGDDILKVAHLEVYWPEGQQRGSLELAYLLVNQRDVDQFISKLPPPTPKKKPQKKVEKKPTGKLKEPTGSGNY